MKAAMAQTKPKHVVTIWPELRSEMERHPRLLAMLPGPGELMVMDGVDLSKH